MNNLSSYCGLVDAKIRAPDKDLTVHFVRATGYVLVFSNRSKAQCAVLIRGAAFVDLK